MNINRDYLIINDVKKSNITLDNGSMFFYITDKNTQNIFVNLVINISNNDLIQKYANIENAEDYTLTMNIVKPDNTYKVVKGKLHDKEKAIFEFDLKEDCVDKIGTYRCELLTKCTINGHEEITTSNKLTYKVKSSVLNDLDDIVEAPEYPLVIQLFDKLSDIEQYEEDRRANELARQLAEEQRQTRFDTLDADMVDRVNAMDSKMDDIEARISTKEQAVDKLIVDTKKDIDDYKVAKDTEINEYKTAKDQQINEAITAQDNKIDTAISEQNNRITVVENNVAAQNDRLDIVENKNTQQDNRLDIVEAKNTEQDNRLNAVEAIDVAQNTRLDAIEVKNQQQDDRLLDVEKVNKRQDMDLKCLFAESKNNMIDITEEGNSIYLQNSTTGYALIDEIKGNTLVNCNKEPDKELILNGNINTSGDNTITLTEGVDGGLVDVALEGNTLVNVSKTKDSTAITKAYTVENSGNHIALQGNVDGSCRPVVSGKTLVNLANGKLFTYSDKLVITDSTITYDLPKGNGQPGIYANLSYSLKPSTEYTVIVNVLEYTTGVLHFRFRTNNSASSSESIINSAGLNKIKLTTDLESSCTNLMIFNRGGIDNQYTISRDIIILEGDYTDKPIPDYFEGLQSTFEDNLVTQEMVDNGEELADNLGKYKVDYKSTQEDGTVGSTKTLYLNSPLLEGDTIEEKDGGIYHVHRSTKVVLDGRENWQYASKEFYYAITNHKQNGSIASDKIPYGETNISQAPDNHHRIKLGRSYGILIRNDDISSISNFKQWLSENPVKIVYELGTPTYELIEQSNLVIPSYTNGHLDFNTAVPVEKVDFLPFNEELTYLYATTQYTVQFNSDKAIAVDITLGGTLLLAQSIVAGLNRISITTPATLADNKLVIDGVGANIMEVVVTNTDREFGYFESMKSVGECEELEVKSSNKNLFNGEAVGKGYINAQTGQIIASNNNLHYNYIPVKGDEFISISTQIPVGGGIIAQYDINKNFISATDSIIPRKEKLRINTRYIRISINYKDVNCNQQMSDDTKIQLEYGDTATDYIPHQSNTQQLTHEPLRAVGDAKDRYVLLDGNWYIERNCAEVNASSLNWTDTGTGNSYSHGKRYIWADLPSGSLNGDVPNVMCGNYIPIAYNKYNYDGECIYISNTRVYMYIDDTLSNFLTKDIKFIIINPQPQYEPLDYNPFEVYSDITHISNNSTIPCNMTIKNTGYNCLLKPNTTYTVSSNLGLNVVTTPSTLTEDCLRFYDTDTSDVTTMKNVMVLEGDYTTGKPLPSHFSGIESAFEQEYDETVGKYKVKIRVQNEDASKENYIEFYIDEPLRGIGDVKDKVYVKNDKVVVERNCGSVVLDGSADESWNKFGTDTFNNITRYSIKLGNEKPDSNIVSDKFARKDYRLDEEFLFVGGSSFVILGISKLKVSSQNTILLKQWLQQNPVKVVYQLAEPTYEEVEYNDVKLFIESFKNSTLFYNSNVPVTSKLYYSYSVPIVDTVAQTASISDEQDVMIIDLATQVAVMEMMLM